MVDTDVVFSYLVNDRLSSYSEKLVNNATEGSLSIVVASEIYDDMITGLRSDNVSKDVILALLGDLRKLAHEVLPTTLDVAEEALRLYARYGGPRKLHYFDSFHVATAKQYDLPLVTSDRYILENSTKLGLTSIDLRKV
jgi:predicted nucleic acid-binding protein